MNSKLRIPLCWKVGGTEGRQIEAQAAASQAARALQSAERVIAPLDERLVELARNWQGATGATRAFYREQFRAIRGSEEYQSALGRVKDAVEDDAEAQERLNKISSGTSIIRNIAAITVAGSAFGIGLKVVDVAAGAAAGAIGELIDIQTGFGATSTKVTAELAKQTLALHGNVDAALAAAEAQAGLTTAGSDALNMQLKLATQIKAGAQAQAQATELTRAAAGVGPQNGLFGGYGGLGGSGLLAEQLGGGRGFTESLLQQVQAASGRGGNPFENIGGALGFLNPFNADYRNAVVAKDRQTQQQPILPGGIQGPTIAGVSDYLGGVGDFLSSLNPFGQNFGANVLFQGDAGRRDSSGRLYGSVSPGTAAAPPSPTVQAVQADANAAAQRGAQALGSTKQATLEYTTNADEIARATQAAARAGDTYGVSLAQQYGLVVKLGGALAETNGDYQQAIQQLAVGRGIADPGQLAALAAAQERQRQIESRASVGALTAQQAFARPAILDQIQRQFDVAQQTNKAQAALGFLAAPPTPVGTGITAKDQEKVKGVLSETANLQKQLNSYYAEGKQLLIDTYQVPASLIGNIQAVGEQIATTQAGIANQQANYAVAQYNYQLFIAKRTLGDISGLTGHAFGVPATQLGTLERANLLLGRQAQQLQFGLSQRQINFQQAVAGFTVPGLTPAEQNARVEEAKIETSYAQKQLDIQRQMFGNQVKIVDIGNLRQGADLVKQISLLQQGRQVTINTAAAEQKIARLQAQQQILTQEAGTYITKTLSLVQAADAEIAAREAATGRAISKVERQGVLAAYAVGRAFFDGISGGLLTFGTKPSNTPGSGQFGAGGSGGGGAHHALGGLYSTKGLTALGPGDYAGEAGSETVAILRNPRQLMGMGEGGGHTEVNFHGDMIFKTEADFQRLYRMILQALGRDAATKGLRTPF